MAGLGRRRRNLLGGEWAGVGGGIGPGGVGDGVGPGVGGTAGPGGGTSDGGGLGITTTSGPPGPTGPGTSGPPGGCSGPGTSMSSGTSAGNCDVASSPPRPAPPGVVDARPPARLASHRRRKGVAGRAAGSLSSNASSRGVSTPARSGGRGGSRTMAVMVGMAEPLS